jgi:hypothetical protein
VCVEGSRVESVLTVGFQPPGESHDSSLEKLRRQATYRSLHRAQSPFTIIFIYKSTHFKQRHYITYEIVTPKTKKSKVFTTFWTFEQSNDTFEELKTRAVTTKDHLWSRCKGQIIMGHPSYIHSYNSRIDLQAFMHWRI